jgi:hypothetical protein
LRPTTTRCNAERREYASTLLLTPYLRTWAYTLIGTKPKEMRPQILWHGPSGHASTHQVARNIRTCVYTSSITEHQDMRLHIK